MSIISKSPTKIFDGDDLSATQTYVYNASQSTVATSGWYNAKYDDVTVQLCVATLNAGTVFYRIEGKFPQLDRCACVVATKVGAAHSIDILYDLPYGLDEVRIGFKVVASTGANNVYAGLFGIEKK